jgi:Tfp pilus assembly protein PilX
VSLLPSLFALLIILIYSAASSRIVQDDGLLVSQRADRLLALQRAETELAHATSQLAHGGNDALNAALEILPSAADAELDELPLLLHRVTVTGEAGSARVRLQADYAVDGCESAHDDDCVSRVRRIAWRQLPLD